MAKKPSPKASRQVGSVREHRDRDEPVQEGVAAVFDALTAEIGKALGKKGTGASRFPACARSS